MKNHKIDFKYSKINNYIYVGSNFCCQTHFDKDLLDKGIRADISMEKERLDQPHGVDYFLWLPTINEQAPSQKQLLVGVRTMSELLANKVKIYVHCMNGHGRAPTMVIAYFISAGESLETAIDLVKKKRPEMHLNKKQLLALKKFAQKFK